MSLSSLFVYEIEAKIFRRGIESHPASIVCRRQSLWQLESYVRSVCGLLQFHSFVFCGSKPRQDETCGKAKALEIGFRNVDVIRRHLDAWIYNAQLKQPLWRVEFNNGNFAKTCNPTNRSERGYAPAGDAPDRLLGYRGHRLCYPDADVCSYSNTFTNSADSDNANIQGRYFYD